MQQSTTCPELSSSSFAGRQKRHLEYISNPWQVSRLRYGEPDDAIEDAKSYSRSHHAVIRGSRRLAILVKTHEKAGRFQLAVGFWGFYEDSPMIVSHSEP